MKPGTNMSACQPFDCKLILRNFDVFRWNESDPKYTFETYGNFTRAPHLQSNPDISGIGVITSFVTTGYLTTLLVVLTYVFFPNYSSLKPVDRMVLRSMGRDESTALAEKWRKPVTALVLAFSDQQVVTGFAILASAVYQLSCGISAYHWQVVVYLAWFSSMTHLGTLTILRDYFLSHRWTRILRMILMCLLVGFLVFALIPTGSVLWLPLYNTPQYEATSLQLHFSGDIPQFYGDGDPRGIPAQCYFDALRAVSRKELAVRDYFQGYVSIDKQPNYPRYDIFTSQSYTMIISLTIILLSFWSRIIKMFGVKSAFEVNRIRNSLGMFQKGLSSLSRPFGLSGSHRNTFVNVVLGKLAVVLSEVVLVFYILCIVVVELLSSLIFEILWFVFAVIWGSIKLFTTRAQGNGMVKDEESFWGFGQLLACVLLVLPFLAAWESIYEVLVEMGNSFHDEQQRNNQTEIGVAIGTENQGIRNDTDGVHRMFLRAVPQRTPGWTDNREDNAANIINATDLGTSQITAILRSSSNDMSIDSEVSPARSRVEIGVDWAGHQMGQGSLSHTEARLGGPSSGSTQPTPQLRQNPDYTKIVGSQWFINLQLSILLYLFWFTILFLWASVGYRCDLSTLVYTYFALGGSAIIPSLTYTVIENAIFVRDFGEPVFFFLIPLRWRHDRSAVLSKRAIILVMPVMFFLLTLGSCYVYIIFTDIFHLYAKAYVALFCSYIAITKCRRMILS